MKEGIFPTRFKLKVIVNGEIDKVVKSKDFGYIMSTRNEIKTQYKPSEVEFKIASSKVKKVKKPRYRVFTNIPEWIEHYGVNSDDEYYGANDDYSKVIRLREI